MRRRRDCADTLHKIQDTYSHLKWRSRVKPAPEGGLGCWAERAGAADESCPWLEWHCPRHVLGHL